MVFMSYDYCGLWVNPDMLNVSTAVYFKQGFRFRLALALAYPMTFNAQVLIPRWEFVSTDDCDTAAQPVVSVDNRAAGRNQDSLWQHVVSPVRINGVLPGALWSVFVHWKFSCIHSCFVPWWYVVLHEILCNQRRFFLTFGVDICTFVTARVDLSHAPGLPLFIQP